VDIERNNAIRSGSLDELSDIPCVHRIAGLRAAILARVGQVRNYRDYAPGSRVPQRLQQKQQPDESLRDGRSRGVGERLHDEDHPVAYRLQRPQFELAARILPLLECGQLDPGGLARNAGQRGAFTRGEDQRLCRGSRAHRASRSTRPNCPASDSANTARSCARMTA